MKRHLFNIACVLSLLLCAATLALWARSYWRTDAVVYASASGHCAVQWASGVLIIGTDDARQPQRSLRLDSWSAVGLETVSFPWWRLGFGYEHTITTFATFGPTTIRARRVFVPFWSIVAAFAILPTAELLRWYKRRKRVASGRCLCCGYDIRATPDCCPECGAVPQATTNAAA